MFSSTRMITAVFAALALASSGYAAPAPADGDVSNLSARAVAPTSRFVIYSDNWVTGAVPPASTLKVRIVILKLLLVDMLNIHPCFARATTSLRSRS